MLPARKFNGTYGAHDADRTRDLVLTKDVLYQLSYMGSRHSFAIRDHAFSRLPANKPPQTKMERAMGFEPTTASLEGWNSTTELRPQYPKNSLFQGLEDTHSLVETS